MGHNFFGFGSGVLAMEDEHADGDVGEIVVALCEADGMIVGGDDLMDVLLDVGYCLSVCW